MFELMLEPILEIGKHLGMQGLLLVYIIWQAKQNSLDQDAQRKAHTKEREEWKNSDKVRQEQLIDIINKTNESRSKVNEELSLIKSQLRNQ